MVWNWKGITGILLLLSACQNNVAEKHPASGALSGEAREDSLQWAAALERQSLILPEVHAALETTPVMAKGEDDAADDPALWVHPVTPEQSLIFGSNKKGGIAMYNLQGKQLAYFEVGKMNNLDVLYGLDWNGGKIDVLGGTNRSTQSVDLYRIHADSATLVPLFKTPFKMDSTRMDDVYGFCFYKDTKAQQAYLFVNAKNGRLEQYAIHPLKNDKLDLKLVRSVQFDSQVEGMVADAQAGVLYVGEEDRGIWKLSANATSKEAPKLLPWSTQEQNEAIHYDVEGLDIYNINEEEGYLVVSSQGNFSYAVFERQGENAYLGSFKISAHAAVDGVEETDGLAFTNQSLGPLFPKGVMVVQDGQNNDRNMLLAQNFKIVDWREIARVIAAFEKQKH
jgi:3-phytase